MIIYLILKVDTLCNIKQFSPISLCNVLYKVITKILANRLKRIIGKLVALMQCSFVRGRHGSDNIIIVQEAIHSMRTKNGSKGFMAIKIDIVKAYDRLKWNFVKETLLV